MNARLKEAVLSINIDTLWYIIVVYNLLQLLKLIYHYRSNARVQPEKAYDARGGATNADAEEIYIPPSETGSTCMYYN